MLFPVKIMPASVRGVRAAAHQPNIGFEPLRRKNWRGLLALTPNRPKAPNSLPNLHASQAIARREVSDVSDGSAKISSLGQILVSTNTIAT